MKSGTLYRLNSMNDIQKTDAKILETVMMGGDLSPLSSEQRMSYYVQVCESMKLNPLTKPFDYLKLNGKLILYANKNCAEQIRQTRGISLTLPEKKIDSDVYIVTARAEAGGRTDEATGAVSLEHLKGEQRANAIMKAETKAKRRVTLSFAGLGMLDESEIESIPGAQKVAEKDITPEQKKTDNGNIKAAQAEFERSKGISPAAPGEEQPTSKQLEPSPEYVRDTARMSKLPDDIKAFFKWNKMTSRDKILAVLNENHDDPEAIRSYMKDHGWMGSADLSDLAQQRTPEAVVG